MAIWRSLKWLGLKWVIRLRFPDVDFISTQELADWLADPDRTQPLLLDTRCPAEYNVSHLKHAVLLNPDAAIDGLKSLPCDLPIVTYCSVGYRSAAIAQQLQQAGYTQVINLEGSIFAWANEGRPVYQNNQLAQHVHPYSAQWGFFLHQELHSQQQGRHSLTFP